MIFNAEEVVRASLKFSRISGRLTDMLDCFFHQCAHWLQKHVPGAQALGTCWMVRRSQEV
jgi:hypothetical protein